MPTLAIDLFNKAVREAYKASERVFFMSYLVRILGMCCDIPLRPSVVVVVVFSRQTQASVLHLTKKA